MFPSPVPRPLSARVSRLASLALAALLASGAFGVTNDLSVARQALRDGFWSLARTHAASSATGTNACDEARRIVLESWAGEGKWSKIPGELASWGNPSGEAFVYYRALALAKTGDPTAARACYGAGLPKDATYRRLGARLLADLALARGEPAETVRFLSSVPDPAVDDRLLLAEAHSRLNDRAKASVQWRAVLSATNATLRARLTAAANLGDEAVLGQIATNDVSAELRTLAELRLGTVLLANPKRFDEAAKRIRKIMTQSPDVEGAREAASLLAATRLARKDWKGAATAYAEILEIWPDAARRTSVQEGLGWALLKDGRADEALQAFHRAEACAATDEERASAGAKTADALAALGRIEESTKKCREVLAAGSKTSVARRLKEVVRLRELEAEGRTLYRNFRFADAQKAFHEIGAGDPVRSGRMQFFEVLCLYGQGHDGEAERRARKLAGETGDVKLKADVTQWLARFAYNAGRWREAKDLFAAYAAFPGVSPADAATARVWSARAALSANDFAMAISLAAQAVQAEVPGAVRAEAQIVQGEALLEQARFDEAVLVFERAALSTEVSAPVRLSAEILRADALYALGADNSARYEEALAAYRSIGQVEQIPNESRLSLAYKIGITLEKLKRRNEAIDQYYAHVILAYRQARLDGRRLDDESQAVFARAAFRLADLCEASGHFLQAQKTLELVVESNVPASAEAQKRLDRLHRKENLP